MARRAQNALEPGYASKILQGFAGGFVVAVLLIVIFEAPFPVAVMFGVIGIAAMWPTELAARKKHALKTLEREPWQVWPCRLEGEGASADNQAFVGARVLLLAPDRTPVAAFRGAMSVEHWLSVRDGRGVVWFCGDLRVGGWIALPARPASSLFRAVPAPDLLGAGTTTGALVGLEEAAIAAATSETVWTWISEQ
ncbi:hypothetical protein [Streptomyces sp. NPDC007369]|uniref:hypothetical protein n=1 Tax=Streptomyces sp. NPDC007369 TaxID=3154589 RepID=UPI0033EF2B0E